MNTAGVVTAKEIASKSNADILSFSADEATKLVTGLTLRQVYTLDMLE